ncbi:transcription termination factor 1 [Spea bombifrons]|uniref:transcription termination factor 1 n=1 Tax=Spea bombifrons TaxID=233779 RepID=UPI0023498011|nr:transcription termination factor 1 [Spea bombifrons]
MEDSTLDYNSQDVDRKRVKKKTKKKDRIHALSGPETGGEAEVEEAETRKRKEKPFDAQENKMHRKKKEKQFLIKEEEEDGENERENVECLQINSEDVMRKPQKHKKKRKEKLVAEEESGENQNEENDTAAVDQLEIIKEADVQESKTPKKKKKNKNLEAEDRDTRDEQVLELVTPSDQTDVEYTQEHKARRRKRKKGHVQEEENGEHQNEENDTAAVDQLEMIREAEVQGSKTPKKKKKKKILEAEDRDTRDEQVLELVTQSDQTDVDYTQEHKARRRKRKKGHVQEEDSSISDPTTSCIGETTISENTDSEVFVSLKKKKKKRITDALQADADSEIQSASKSPGRNEQLQDSLQVMETGSDCEPQLGESPRKRKKKKKRHSQHGHDEQPESSYVVTEHDNSQVSASETRPESPDNDPSVNVVEAQLTKGDDDDSTIVPKEEAVPSKPVSKKRAHKALINVRKRDLGLLKEYFPNLSSFSKKRVNNLISCELERVKEAKQRGVLFNRGRFTDEENKQLTENVKSFLKLSGIKNEEMLFHSYRYPEKKKIIEEIKKKFNFRLRISEGIPRTVEDICHRGVKLFDFSGNKGRFTDEEVKQLKKNWKIHGNNWIAVGALMGRNNIKLQLKASQLRRKVNKGAWSVEETNLLISAVKEYILSLEEHATSGNESDIIIQKPKLYKGIPWVQIEEKVKTRNWTQCKTKWTEILFLRMNNGVSMFEGISGVESQMKIIQWLYESGPKESGQVNWEELADHIGNVPPMILQIKYYNLKTSHVPDWQKLSFKEIVNYLYTEVVPMFAEKLNANHGRQTKHAEAFEKRDDYSVSEIFFEYTDKENVGSEKVKRKKSTKKFYSM